MATSSSRLNRALWDLDAVLASATDTPLSVFDVRTADPSLAGAPRTITMVAIEAIAVRGETDTLSTELEALGLTSGATAGRMVSGLLPVSSLDALEDLESLAFVNPAISVTASQGEAENQGDFAMNADIARNLFGVDGTGVSVGALSDSFDFLNGEDDDIASGDLPAGGVRVIQDFSANDPSDEGRAMLQIIHDVAPGADLSFATAFGGQANFARNIQRLADAGADIIVDDVAYLAEPFFQDGIVSQAVDAVAAEGVTYFSSAGNQGRSSYEANFRSTGITLPTAFEPGAIAHDWDPGAGVDPILNFTLAPDESIFLSFQWDQPFGSISDVSPGASTDVDIYLVDANTGQRLRDSDGNFVASINPNIGLDPVEIFEFENEGNSTRDLGLVIEHARGPEPDFLKIVFFDSVSFINEKRPEYTSEFSNSTVVGHSAAEGAISVGAAFYLNTPRFGLNPPRLNSFSSQGPTTILFDIDGNRLADPEIRQTPDIVAPDGVDTTFFGSSDPDDTGFNNFFGTSAAAPQAAAVAALLLDANPTLSPDAVREILQDTAINIGPLGFDNASGAGLIQADAAVELALAGGTAPLIAQDDVFNGNEDIIITGNLLADNGNGPDEIVPAGNPIITRINGAMVTGETVLDLASGAALTISEDGTVLYDPQEALNGLAQGEILEETITYQIAAPDGTRESAPATAQFTVLGVNDAPRPADDAFTVAFGETLSANLFADNGNGPDTDPEGTPFILTAINGQSLADGAVTFTLASGALVTAEADGTLFYDPSTVDRSTVTQDSFTYTVSDGTDSAAALVRIDLPPSDGPMPVDQPPLARPDAFVVDEDTELTGNVTADNGAGPDLDPEGEALSVALVSEPSSGTLTLAANGSFVYRPGLNFNGTDSFTYDLSDPAGNTASTTATITVTPVNDLPSPQDDMFTTGENMVLSGDLLADNGQGPDFDPDGDALTLVAINGENLNGLPEILLPSGALLTVDGSGQFTYDPNGAFVELSGSQSGIDSFAYTVSDPSGATQSAQAFVSVEGEEPIITFGIFISEIAEGTGAPTTAGFSLLRSGDLNRTVTVTFEVQQTAGDTVDGADFVGGELPSGTVIFLPGEETQTIELQIEGDSDPEPTETFIVTLTDLTADQGGVGTSGGPIGFVISDDDQAIEPTIVGTPGSDVLFGTGSDDVIDGLAGNDVILANQGADIILGGAGNDVLFGAQGNDTLIGGTGDDLLFGSNDDDIFVMAPGDGSDRIRGFQQTDRIDLRAFSGLSIEDVFESLRQEGRNVRLTLDTDTDVLIESVDLSEITEDQFLIAVV